MDAIEKNSVKGQKVVVKRVASVDELVRCEILFIPASEKDSIPDILKKIASWPTLLEYVGRDRGSLNEIRNKFIQLERHTLELKKTLTGLELEVRPPAE